MLETHVGVEARTGADRAEAFPDTVGVGCYRIDLHPSTAARVSRHRNLSVSDPAGRFAPRLDNLLAGGKCLGVTHVTNGCYRLHPVEWNVGEAAGALAAFCLEQRVSPRRTHTPYLLADFQRITGLDGCPAALARGDPNHSALDSATEIMGSPSRPVGAASMVRDSAPASRGHVCRCRI